MAAGNFSNDGLDTFDEHKRYIGIRLQQGVPLLDRDWNELEDIRRHQERLFLTQFVGSSGVADLQAFGVHGEGLVADVRIGAGYFLLDGQVLWNEADVRFSEQGDGVPLPDTLPGGDDLILTLTSRITRVDAADDPDLANSQDINMETCVRDRLDWSVVAEQLPAGDGAARLDQAEPAGLLALVSRPDGARAITAGMVADRRFVGRTLFGASAAIAEDRRRLDALDARLAVVEADVLSLKTDVGRLFWDIEVASPKIQALFGDKAPLTFRVVDRLGTPVVGATLTLSTDWGTLQPAVVTTGADGRAAATLVGVQTDMTISASDIARLGSVATKVAAAALPNPGSIQYAKVRFEPDEMALVSRFTPSNHLDDLISDLPDAGIVAQPHYRTATVTVHAKEGASVRGVGSIQVSFGHWVRDWALTKLHEVVSKVSVGARIGDVMRQGVAGQQFDHSFVADRLPVTLQAISDQTQQTVKQSLFADPDLADDDLQGSGFLGQVISQEATAAIGATAQRAVATQLDQLVSSDAVTIDPRAAGTLNQTVSQVSAGLAQSAKQKYSMAGRIG
jgi:hypothetical protein